LGDALAVWYSLGNLAVVIAAWQTFPDSTQALRTIDSTRLALVARWNVSSDVLGKLRATVADTEAAAAFSFTGCKNGIDLQWFFNRYVSRILGAPIEFSNRSTLEDQLMGLRYRGKDATLVLRVCRTFVKACTETKHVLDKAHTN